MIKTVFLVYFSLMLTCMGVPSSKTEGEIPLVYQGAPKALIVVAEDANEYTREAVGELNAYIEEISGTKLEVVHQKPKTGTESLIWVGGHPGLHLEYPQEDFEVAQPEEILIQSVGNDLVILGNDVVMEDGTQTVAGTALATSVFIEEFLGVRWLWPGKWGTDIPKSETIQVNPVSLRYTPQLKLRTYSIVSYRRQIDRSKALQKALRAYIQNPLHYADQKDRETQVWLRHHRTDARATGDPFVLPMAGSWSTFRTGHGFQGWWEKYHKTHPEYFAMQPDGSRQEDLDSPYPDAKNVKMCPSSPGLAAQWLKDAKAFFHNTPYYLSYTASEKDLGWQGYCLCEDCLSWDNKEAEILENPIRWKKESREFYALTDRYSKLWNHLARGLKEEFPNRDVNVSVMAYHVNRPAPTIKLEENIIPLFVGIERRFYYKNNMEHTLDQRRIWEGWWKAVEGRNHIIWRPNIIYRTLGLPYMFTKRHADNMHYLAEHGLGGMIHAGGSGGSWATQGPQLYLNAKLMWNPRLDEKEVLADYYKRAFGPAGEAIAQYFQVFEDLYTTLAEDYKGQNFHVYRDPPLLYREIRLDSQPATSRIGNEGITPHRAIETKADGFLIQAEALVKHAEVKYRERVAMIREGFRFIQAQLDSIEGMNRYRENPSDENKKAAYEAVIRRKEIILANLDNFAFNPIAVWGMTLSRPQDLGSEEIVQVRETKEDQENLMHQLEQ